MAKRLDTVDVYRNLKLVGHLTIDTAEHVYMVNDLEGCIEEYGRCDVGGVPGEDMITIVAHGDPAPTTYYVGE